MRVCSIIGHESDRNNLVRLAQVLERRGWEVVCNVAGVGDRTALDTRPSYFHHSWDLIAIVISAKFAQARDDFYQHALRGLNSNQANMLPMYFEDDWMRSPLSEDWKKFSLVPFSSETIDTIIDNNQRPTHSADNKITREDALGLVQTICGLDEVSVISESHRAESRYDLFHRCARETDNHEYWLVVYPTAQLNLVEEAIHDLFETELDKRFLKVIRASKTGGLSETQIRNTSRIFDADASSFSGMVSKYAQLSEGAASKRMMAYTLNNSDKYVEVFCAPSGTAYTKSSGVGATQAFYAQWEATRHSNDKRIIAFKGTAGRGKTHLLKHLNDKLIEDGIKTIFLNPAIIRSQMNSEELDPNAVGVRINCLYDAYQLFRKFQDLDSMPRNLFEIELKTASIVIFVDGIEEIRATLGTSFNERAFMSNCFEAMKSSSACQIVIASRFNFWEHLYADSVRDFNILPFDSQQLDSFLIESFESLPRLQDKCRKLINQITSVEKNGVSPFVADQIVELVRRERNQDDSAELAEKPIDFSSEILVSLHPSDILVGTLIDRDKEKIKLDWGVDLWCEILAEFAAKSEFGICTVRVYLDAIEKVLNRELVEAERLAVTVHSMVEERNGYVDFPEPHFKEFFISLYIFRHILSVESVELSQDNASILKSHAVVGSQTNTSLARWCETLERELVYNLVELKLLSDEVDEAWMTPNFRLQFVSTLFNLALELNIEADYPRTNNHILDLFFGADKCYERAIFKDFNGTRIENEKFDFRGKTLRSCLFHHYDGLWDNQFDEHTHWINPQLHDCKPPLRVSRKQEFGKFESVQASSDIQSFITSLAGRSKTSSDAIKEELVNFFTTMFGSQLQNSFKSEEDFEEAFSSRRLGLSTSKLVHMVKSHRLIELGPHPQKPATSGYTLTKLGRVDVAKLLDQRQLRGLVSELVRELSDE